MTDIKILQWVLEIGQKMKTLVIFDDAAMKGNPGPGTYKLPSVFDLKRRFKVPLN